MCTQCDTPEARAAAVAAMGALPWEAREKEFYGANGLGAAVPCLCCHAFKRIGAKPASIRT